MVDTRCMRVGLSDASARAVERWTETIRCKMMKRDIPFETLSVCTRKGATIKDFTEMLCRIESSIGPYGVDITYGDDYLIAMLVYEASYSDSVREVLIGYEHCIKVLGGMFVDEGEE